MTKKRRSFAELRAAYDQAFERLALQVRELERADSERPRDEVRVGQLRQRLEEAETAYRGARDQLAVKILKRSSCQPGDYCSGSPDSLVSELTASFHSTAVGSLNQ